MASSLESPAPLKGKLSQVKYLLDDASKRLQEEASKYEIFTTKTSASGSSTLQQNGDQNVPTDLIRSISDISTLKSVLSCPIFNRIVNVTDSLDKISYQLNLHPSIGPSDINIDSNGELILAPPIEPASLNNLINSKLDEYSDHSNNSPQIISSNLVQNNKAILNERQHQIRQAQPTNSNFNGSEVGCSNRFVQVQPEKNKNLINQQPYDSQKHVEGVQNYIPSPNMISSVDAYNTEKLVSNGNGKTYVNSKKLRHRHSTNIDFESDGDDGRRLYKSNGHFTLDQTIPGNIDMKSDFQSTQSMNQIGEQVNDSRKNGYSNEMYRTTHELNQSETMAIEHQKTQLNRQNHNSHIKNVQSHDLAMNGKVKLLQSSGVQYNRGSCSPSTSAGSTVRLADDCDSGASSYQSHNAKGTPYSSFPYKSNDQINETQAIVASSEDRVNSMEQELIDNLSPEMEKIKVTLEKDSTGLGITIAGYTCEKEEISGIFIKSITSNSPADKSGKIRTLDQIFAVDGRELIGYSNPEAVNVLRRTGKVVTLELMRYLAESKYQKLQTALAHAVPTMNTSSNSKLFNTDNASSQIISDAQSSNTNLIVSPTKSSIPVSKMRDNNLSSTRPASPLAAKPTFVKVSNCQQEARTQPVESIYKNESVSNSSDVGTPMNGSHTAKSPFNLLNITTPDVQSHIPVAAQRGGTNKVIETKQGARNTVDIRSPVCQTTTATYVNKVAEMEYCDSAKKSVTARLQKEASDEFGRLIRSEEPEWEKDAQIIEIYKDTSQGLGFTVKEYANPKDQKQSIIMITSLTPGGIAERDGRLSFGDLLIFVDDTNLEGASLTETVKALKRTNGQVRLGVLKLKRN